MSAQADAIIVGEQRGSNTAAVKRWIHFSGNMQLSEKIGIDDLDKHSKEINAALYWQGVTKDKPKLLKSHRFVAFLTHKSDSWQALETVKMGEHCGSCGLIWIEDGCCYRYIQPTNPGPCDLAEARDLKTETDLLAAIETALANKEYLLATLAIKDPHDRASALTAYLLERTSPEKPHWALQGTAFDAIVSLGKMATPALRKQIQTSQPGDSLNDVVLAIDRIGPGAQEAVPELLQLLLAPDKANLEYVLAALGATADKSAIPKITPFLTCPNKDVRSEAAKTIELLSRIKG